MTARSATPLVSVIVTAYNHERYIAQAVESVLAQTYTAREVIVVDDGSTDATSTVLGTFGHGITHIRQANTGVAGSRNRGIREATGQLLAFLDGDDFWHPDKLRCQVDAFTIHPNAGLIVCDGREVDDEKTLRETLFPEAVRSRFVGDAAVACWNGYTDLVRNNLISTTSQLMIPRAVMADVGLSDTAFPVASDFDLYLRIGRKYPLVFVREALAYWRYLASSVSGPASHRYFNFTQDTVAVLRKQLRDAPRADRLLIQSTAARKAREAARLAYYKGCDGERSWAVAYLRQLLKQSGHDATVGMYFLGLLAPAWLRRPVARTLGRVLFDVEKR